MFHPKDLTSVNKLFGGGTIGNPCGTRQLHLHCVSAHVPYCNTGLNAVLLEERYRWADVHRLVTEDHASSTRDKLSGNIVSLVKAQTDWYCQRVQRIQWTDGYAGKSLIHQMLVHDALVSCKSEYLCRSNLVRVCRNQVDKDLVLFVCGPMMNELVCWEMDHDKENENVTDQNSFFLSTDSEISILDLQQNIGVCVSAGTDCHIFKMHSRYFEEMDIVRFKSRIRSSGINPHIALDELFCIDGDGDVLIWDIGNQKAKCTRRIDLKSGDLWMRGAFQAHPRTFSVVNTKNLYALDLRTPDVSLAFEFQNSVQGFLNQCDYGEWNFVIGDVDRNVYMFDYRFKRSPVFNWKTSEVIHEFGFNADLIQFYGYNKDFRSSFLFPLNSVPFQMEKIICNVPNRIKMNGLGLIKTEDAYHSVHLTEKGNLFCCKYSEVSSSYKENNYLLQEEGDFLFEKMSQPESLTVDAEKIQKFLINMDYPESKARFSVEDCVLDLSRILSDVQVPLSLHQISLYLKQEYPYSIIIDAIERLKVSFRIQSWRVSIDRDENWISERDSAISNVNQTSRSEENSKINLEKFACRCRMSEKSPCDVPECPISFQLMYIFQCSDSILTYETSLPFTLKSSGSIPHEIPAVREPKPDIDLSLDIDALMSLMEEDSLESASAGPNIPEFDGSSAISLISRLASQWHWQ